MSKSMWTPDRRTHVSFVPQTIASVRCRVQSPFAGTKISSVPYRALT